MTKAVKLEVIEPGSAWVCQKGLAAWLARGTREQVEAWADFVWWEAGEFEIRTGLMDLAGTVDGSGRVSGGRPSAASVLGRMKTTIRNRTFD